MRISDWSSDVCSSDLRKPAAGWPIEFELDDSTAMIQGMKLSAFERVNIIARVSRLGNASPQTGDLEGRLENISLGSAGIHVVLDKIVGEIGRAAGRERV